MGASNATVLSVLVPKELAEVVYLLGEEEKEEEDEDDDDSEGGDKRHKKKGKKPSKSAAVSEDLGVRHCSCGAFSQFCSYLHRSL